MNDTIDITFPTSWREINRKQLLIVAEILSTKRTRAEYLTMLFLRLSGLKVVVTGEGSDENFLFEYEGKRCILSADFVMGAASQMSYLLDSVELPGESPIDGINVKLNGIDFDAYYYADALLYRYHQTGDVMTFYHVVDTIAPGVMKDRDITETFIAAWSIWWKGVNEMFKRKYPNVYEDSGGGEGDKTPLDSLREMIIFLSDNKPNLWDEIAHSEVHTVLLSLNNKISEYKNYGNS